MSPSWEGTQSCESTGPQQCESPCRLYIKLKQIQGNRWAEYNWVRFKGLISFALSNPIDFLYIKEVKVPAAVTALKFSWQVLYEFRIEPRVISLNWLFSSGWVLRLVTADTLCRTGLHTPQGRLAADQVWENEMFTNWSLVYALPNEELNTPLLCTWLFLQENKKRIRTVFLQEAKCVHVAVLADFSHCLQVGRAIGTDLDWIPSILWNTGHYMLFIQWVQKTSAPLFCVTLQKSDYTRYTNL